MKAKTKKGISQLAGLVISFIVFIMVLSIGVLIGGVFDKTTGTIFTQLGVSSNWTNIKNTATSYTITGLNLLSIAIIISAAMSLVAVVLMYFRGGGGT